MISCISDSVSVQNAKVGDEEASVKVGASWAGWFVCIFEFRKLKFEIE